MTTKALWQRQGSGCYRTLHTEIARLHYDSKIERLAIGGLNDGDVEVACDASAVLGAHGSSASKAALLARINKGASTDAAAYRARLEPALVDAICGAQRWLVNLVEIKQLRSSCVTKEGRNRVDEMLRLDGGTIVPVRYWLGSPNYWSIGRYSGKGMELFKKKLAQYSRGTVFDWHQDQLGPESEILFKQIQSYVRDRGMTLQKIVPK